MTPLLSLSESLLTSYDPDTIKYVRGEWVHRQNYTAARAAAHLQSSVEVTTSQLIVSCDIVNIVKRVTRF